MAIHQFLSLPIVVISSITSFVVFPSPSFATKLDFIVENKTNVDLVKLSIDNLNSPPNQASLVSNEVVKSGESVVLRFKVNPQTCWHDITGVFRDGEVVKERNVNLCKTEIYTFSDN